MKIGLFYGSTTCYTEIAAERIRDTLGADLVDLHNIKFTSLQQIADYQVLIFGISTWDFGELQEDWESHWQEVNELNLSGKIVALFGLGDQENYGEWFQDALGMLHEALEHTGATSIGYWPNSEEYQFVASKALTEDERQFVGLALDDESQYEQSETRIANWCQQLRTELAEQGIELP